MCGVGPIKHCPSWRGVQQYPQVGPGNIEWKWRGWGERKAAQVGSADGMSKECQARKEGG
jgi:hypothetical protein